VERGVQHIEKVVLRIAVTGTPESIRECMRNFALDLPNDISRVEFAPLEIARLDGVEQLGEQDRADFDPPRPPRRKRPHAAGVQTQQSSPPAPKPRPPPLRLNASALAHGDPLERPMPPRLRSPGPKCAVPRNRKALGKAGVISR